MDYKNIVTDGDNYRKNYLEGIEGFISRQKQEGYANRERFMPVDKLLNELENYREKYLEMLGLDKFASENCPEPKMIFAGSDDVCEFYRVVVHITPEIPFHGLFFKPHGTEKTALIIAQHGGGGTPELCSDMNGKNNYNHMVKRLLKKGVSVFAPQLLLWNVNKDIETAPNHNIPYNRQAIDVELKSLGISITALEIKGIMNAITYISSLPFIEQEKIGMTGISYGGYFTIYTMAADTRIKAGYSNAVFNDRSNIAFADWRYNNSINTFHDAEVAALCAPRKLYVAVGKEDKVFDYKPSINEAARVQKYFDAFGCSENFVYDLWDGGHTMSCRDDGIDFLLGALKGDM